MNENNKPRKEAICAGQEVHAYLCKQGIYLTEEQAEAVARNIDAAFDPLYRASDRIAQEVDDLKNHILHGEEEE